MITGGRKSVNHFNRAGYRSDIPSDDHFGDGEMITAAPTGMEGTAERRVPLALTGKQKVALMLARAGYSHAFIAEKMGLAHRETATRLITRARAADKALRAAITEFLGTN